MNVLVAADAALRRRLEPDLSHLGVRTGRPVAIHAAHNTVTPEQRKRRRPVVERLQFAPGAHFMTGFADALPRLQLRFRRLGKLAVVRILVASFAGPVREMVFAIGAMRRFFFAVTVQTGDGPMRPL